MIDKIEGYGTWSASSKNFHTEGIHIAAGNFRAHGPSTLRLQADLNFDDAPLFAYGESVLVMHHPEEGGSGGKFFQGRCISVPRFGNAEGEGQIYEIADAWHDLERIIYQERWGYAVPDIDTYAPLEDDTKRIVPRFVFGLDENGDPIRIGDIIRNVIDYAATNEGVNIEAGSIPDGEYPFHAEMVNMSCAEIIRMALRLHPDWIPWIDHTAESAPTFNVTRAADMDVVSIPVGTDTAADQPSVLDFQITERLDLLPASVRICYEWADELINPSADDPTVDPPEIYRKIKIDKFPEEGPDGGPNCIVTHIPLAGMTEQRQKARLWCRKIPTGPSHLAAPPEDDKIKEWFAAKYPHLARVPVAEFEVLGFDREMIMEWEGLPEQPAPEKDPPPPINPKAKRLSPVDDPDKYPRELYKGQIEDWMRVKVGKMLIKNVDIQAHPAASPATRKAVAKGFPNFSITATNAFTKRYSGPSQWTPGEQTPVGVAQAVYQSIIDSCRLQGTVTLSDDEVPTTRYIGKKITLGGSGYTGEALVHAVSWDIESGTYTIEVGPSPYLAPTDFLELQRMLRQLPIQWWSKEERDKGRSKYGAESAASAAGDSVAGFDFPETTYEPPDALLVPLHIVGLNPPYIPIPESGAAEGARRYWIEWGTLNDLVATNWDAHYDVSSTTYFFAKATLSSGPFSVSSWQVVTSASATEHLTPAWPVGGTRPSTAGYLLGSVNVVDGKHTILNSGGGSLGLTEHISDIQPDAGFGGVKLGRLLAFKRQNY